MENPTNVIPGGEDTVHISYYCQFTPQFKENLDQIAKAKALAEHPPLTSDEAPDTPKFSPNVRVEIGAMPLIVSGSIDVIMPKTESQLIEMGLKILKNRLGHVDACVDLPFPVLNLQQAIIESRYITRARSKALHQAIDFPPGTQHNAVLSTEYDDSAQMELHWENAKYTGFSLGRDKIVCRGYDKLYKERHREEMLLAL